MSKKHFQAVAAAIYRRRAMAEHIQNRASRQTHYAELTNELADVFAALNPRFDRARFIEACETGKTRGMRQAS